MRRPWTLRARLVVALLVLAAVGLTAVGAASVWLLQRSLIARVDEQLMGVGREWLRPAAIRPRPGDFFGGTRPGPRGPRVPTDFRIVLLNNRGEQVSSFGRPADEGGPALPLLNRSTVLDRGGLPFTVPDTNGDGRWRVRALAGDGSAATAGPNRTAVVAMSLDTVDATVDRLLVIELAVGVLVLAGLGGLTWWVVRVGIRPLTRIEQTAEAIAGGDLDRRVEGADRRTETGRVATALNTMVGRLGAALRQRTESEGRLRRFVGDASHELRTPLTSIRGFAELYRKGGARSKADVDRMMGQIETEAVRMGRLVDDLLLLARLDSERPLDLTEVDLTALAGEAVDQARALSGGAAREIVLRPESEPVHLPGDAGRLRQVVTNLLTNAVRHTPPGTTVTVTVGTARASGPPLTWEPVSPHQQPSGASKPPVALNEELASPHQQMAPAGWQPRALAEEPVSLAEHMASNAGTRALDEEPVSPNRDAASAGPRSQPPAEEPVSSTDPAHAPRVAAAPGLRSGGSRGEPVSPNEQAAAADARSGALAEEPVSAPGPARAPHHEPASAEQQAGAAGPHSGGSGGEPVSAEQEAGAAGSHAGGPGPGGEPVPPSWRPTATSAPSSDALGGEPVSAKQEAGAAGSHPGGAGPGGEPVPPSERPTATSAPSSDALGGEPVPAEQQAGAAGPHAGGSGGEPVSAGQTGAGGSHPGGAEAGGEPVPPSWRPTATNAPSSDALGGEPVSAEQEAGATGSHAGGPGPGGEPAPPSWRPTATNAPSSDALDGEPVSAEQEAGAAGSHAGGPGPGGEPVSAEQQAGAAGPHAGGSGGEPVSGAAGRRVGGRWEKPVTGSGGGEPVSGGQRFASWAGRQLPPGTPVAVVEVADGGAGIPLDQAPYVFDRFYRADPSRARKGGGTGLGLAITAAIVEAHQGLVELHTAPGKGARFRVILPLGVSMSPWQR